MRKVQYLGEAGYPHDCLLAVGAILESGSLPEEATVVSHGSGGMAQQYEYLFLFWGWGHFPVTVVPNGFATGYAGEAPKAFSLALCMIRDKKIPIKEFEASASLFRALNEFAAHDIALLQKLKGQSETVPFPYPGWVLDEHEALLQKKQLWKAYYWREPNADWMNLAIATIDDFHPSVGRKLRLAVEQIATDAESERHQQIGIVVRDAWIEFVQKLRAACEDTDWSGIGTNDVKGMLTKLKLGDEPTSIAKGSYNLALKIQHDRNVTRNLVKSCIVTAVAAMEVLLDQARRNQGFVSEVYHQCPRCGNPDLAEKVEHEWDYDGGVIPMSYLVCGKCDWRIQETGLTTPPF